MPDDDSQNQKVKYTKGDTAMDTLKNTERTAVKDIVTTFNKLSPLNKERLICIGFGMSVADVKHENAAKANA